MLKWILTLTGVLNKFGVNMKGMINLLYDELYKPANAEVNGKAAGHFLARTAGRIESLFQEHSSNGQVCVCRRSSGV